MVRLGLVVALLCLPGLARALGDGRLMGMYLGGGATGPAFAMLDSQIDVSVRGPVIEVVVTQRFRNPSDHATEATYIFPLPADAAVSAMAIQVGARTIHAAIEPRDAAQRRYEAAVAAGAPAALLDQERPDVFTQTVAAIPAHGTVEITLRYDSVARYAAGQWELALPMVVAPRYVPGTASGRATTGSGRSPDTDRAPDASRVTPAASPGAGGPTAVAIHFIDEPAELASPSHALGGTRRDATLTDPRSDHDAIVRWKAAAASAGWVERDDGGGGYAAVVVEAPAPAATRGAVRAVLAIDRAATTRGDGDIVERPLVRAMLDALGAGDRVRVIGSDRLAWSAPDDARAALDRAWASPAVAFDLTRALGEARPDGAAIVVISDGLVADDPAAIAAARRLGVPVHVLGIGPSPARATLTQIAAVTGGTARFVAPGDDLAAVARAVMADVASRPAPIAINWGALVASEVEPVVLPRLGAGQAMLVVARIARPQVANARVRGEVFAFEPLGPARGVDGATTARGPLARRWARERLGDLLVGPHDRAAVTRLALAYGLVSPYTSLVAVGSDVVVEGGVKHSVAVPVSLPSGMRWHAVKQAMDREAWGRASDDRAEAPRGKRDAGKKQPAPAPAKDQQNDATVARSPVLDDVAPAAPSTPSTRSGAAPDDAPSAGDADGIADRDDESAKKRKSVAATEEDEGSVEHIVITGGYARTWRLTAALGGGLAFDHGTRGLAALTGRVEYGARTRLGVEASLWLLDGRDISGRALLTASRLGFGDRLEVGFGAGASFGDGTGVAAALQLRIHTPVAPLAGFLRYDASVVLSRPGIETQHAVTLGLDLSY